VVSAANPHGSNLDFLNRFYSFNYQKSVRSEQGSVESVNMCVLVAA
jgi:hypothetical protein